MSVNKRRKMEDLPKPGKRSHEDERREKDLQQGWVALEERREAMSGANYDVRDADEEQEQSFTEDSILELIRAAQEEANVVQGRHSSADASQGWREQVRSVVNSFLKDQQETPPLFAFGQVIQDILAIVDDFSLCRPLPKVGKKSLFPLPTAGYPEDLGPNNAYFRAVVSSLNSLHGCPGSSQGTKTASQAAKKLASELGASRVLNEKVPNLNFKEFFETRTIDYSGDEIRVSKQMTWEGIKLSLPEEVGSLDLRDFCTGGVLQYVTHFADYMVPLDAQVIGRSPKVMVPNDGEWYKIAHGLVQRGLCDVLPKSDLHQVGASTLQNGLFAVSKQEFQGSIEVLRLIMNLKPLNQLCLPLEGDTPTLPAITSFGTMFLDDDEQLCTSSEDIRCFFYLFATPSTWHKYMSLGRPVPKDLIPSDKQSELIEGENWYLCSKVLPMGFLNSVGIAQHIHRNVIKKALGSMHPPTGGHQEVRRDRVATTHPHIYRVYLDNFDELRKVNRSMAEVISGQPSEMVEKIREAYEASGLPRHPKKSVAQEFSAEVQGAWVDGRKGIVMAKPSKVVKYVRLVMEVLREGRASQRELQVIGGGLVYLAMFRRPLLCGLNQIWQDIVALNAKPSTVRVPLSKKTSLELCRLVGLIPLAYINLRLPCDPVVSVSDASTTGGGFCISRGLSPYGHAACSGSTRGDVYESVDVGSVLSVGLFDGISGLRVSLDALGLSVAGHISVEKLPEARRVVEANFPDTIFVNDVEEVSKELVIQWSLKFSQVAVVAIGAGSPCQGVSGLNSDRRGALRDSRSCLFSHVPRISSLFRAAFPWAQVHVLGENVASMDYKDCEAMNEAYEGQPWYINADGVSLANRPRLYWITWELSPGPGATVLHGSDGTLPIEGEVKLSADWEDKHFLEPGWERSEKIPLPTFTTSRPSATPLRRPAGLKSCLPHELARWQADLHRFPPYQYKDANCLRAKGKDPRIPGISEREAILGFPIGFTNQCMSKKEHGSATHSDCWLSLLGNSWSIPVITWLWSILFARLGFIKAVSLQSIVDRLTPGGAASLQGLLLRPPMKVSTSTFPPSAVLVQKLASLVSMKGECRTGSVPPVKGHYSCKTLALENHCWMAVER